MNNSGASFGIGIPGLEWLALAVLIGVAYKAFKGRSVGLGLIAVGGGLNVGERLLRGFVTDYWKVPLLPLYNNLNDWLIFAGLILYIWQAIKISK